MNTGWTCPRCYRCFSPQTTMCSFCQPWISYPWPGWQPTLVPFVQPLQPGFVPNWTITTTADPISVTGGTVLPNTSVERGTVTPTGTIDPASPTNPNIVNEYVGKGDVWLAVEHRFGDAQTPDQ